MRGAPAHKPLLGIGLVLLSGIFFTALDTTAKTLAQTYPVPLLIWMRYLVHLLLMLVFLGPTQGRKLVVTQRPIALIVRALALLATTGLTIAAFRIMPLGETTAIFFASPLAVAILAGPVLGEKVGRPRWLAMAIGFAGVLLVARPGGAMTSLGIALALGAAAVYTVYQLQTRRLSTTESTVTMLFYTALVGTVIMSFGVPWFLDGPTPTPLETALFLALGVFGGTGHFLLTRAYLYAPASVVASYLYVQILWATLFGGLFFGHWPDALSIAGMITIATSSIAMVAYERHQARKT